MMLNVVFMGSPEFAVPCLNALAEHPNCNLVGVVSQPDKPAGRGRKLTPPPVKARALELELEVYQPPGLRKDGRLNTIFAWKPDLIVVVAYGKILPKALLDHPRLGCVNVHASLLPRHRGASPIHQSILMGDEKTGVALMQMDEGLDTGAVLAQAEYPLTSDSRTPALSSALSALGAQLLQDSIDDLATGKLQAVAQPDQGVTHAPLIAKSDGFLSPLSPGIEADRKVRAYDPWPGTFMMLNDQRVKVFDLNFLEGEATQSPGQVLSTDDGRVTVQWSDGIVELLEVHPAGRKRTAAAAWVSGRGVKVGDTFGLKLP